MSSEPATLRVASWNLWGDERWSERKLSVDRMLDRLAPDVLAVQELSPTNAVEVDRRLGSHRRVLPDLVGTPPVNIWIDQRLLECVDSGSASIDAGEDRVGVWARLRIANIDRSLLVATTHLTWNDYPDPTLGAAMRDRQAARLGSMIESLRQDGDAIVLLGDLNDERRSLDALAVLGLADCHERLAREPDPTQPIPEYEPFKTLPRTVDKIFINRAVEPLDVRVPRLPADEPPPSDHWPVLATVHIDSRSHQARFVG